MAIATEVIKGPQAIFDHVTEHLLNQGKCSTFDGSGGGGCMYRGHDNTACAAGCLIPEEYYHPEMEGNIWTGIDFCLNNGYTEEENRLIRALQTIHDCYHPTEWKNNFQTIAMVAGLKYEGTLYS